ncbi:calcium/calmodulin dependent protein kinase C [Trichoderma citrinoviride]|uniref:Calcium/calmodulin dependent protein kinase C n=1 Tax=Trichoderma citrinoviride TaxID=58853 RepID=A0A2T4BDJ7_9HYPO|nr:calcium/calmodulin dependent protein kinase C [Trichoderma citrinoviride]PTB67412.1 calcium/calmodulin dependent protein kinase C [Trichoderma citrinoviride]
METPPQSPGNSIKSAPVYGLPPPGLQSPRLTVNGRDDLSEDVRPSLASAVTEPPRLHGFASPIRQHKRTPSAHREIKETLDARVEFSNDETDGRTHHRINQYVIQEEIGRGSYGSVHLATDQFGNEYAVKEFSKVRLRRRAQSMAMRQGPGASRRMPARGGDLPPHLVGLRDREKSDALFYIREEIAIMKKLNHPNLAQLIEVLDDPDEDSLYMVMEMCKKGVIMKVGLCEQADPYPEEECRFWFRDLILGIEYLHAQGVIHRDIKPDNLLLSEDDVLKVVDFGVSEMFEKPTNMTTAKTAGSPAFLPPELCSKHDKVSGTAADIWSMGVTLYCLKYGRIPFNREAMLEIYEAIKTEEPEFPKDENPTFVHLMGRLLDKNPETRITMAELREHPWVTKEGTDPLLSAEENCANPVEPPNELELSRAFTRKMNHLLCVMKAIHRFRTSLSASRRKNGTPRPIEEKKTTKPTDAKASAADIAALITQRKKLLLAPEAEEGKTKGQAHDITDQEPPFLGIGTGARDAFATDEKTPDVVSDSPTAVDFNVYDRAYEEAIKERMKPDQLNNPILYLTKHIKEKEYFKKLDNLVDEASVSPSPLKAVGKNSKQLLDPLPLHPGNKLADIVSKLKVSDGSENRSKTRNQN